MGSGTHAWKDSPLPCLSRLLPSSTAHPKGVPMEYHLAQDPGSPVLYRLRLQRLDSLRSEPDLLCLLSSFGLFFRISSCFHCQCSCTTHEISVAQCGSVSCASQKDL